MRLSAKQPSSSSHNSIMNDTGPGDASEFQELSVALMSSDRGTDVLRCDDPAVPRCFGARALWYQSRWALKHRGTVTPRCIAAMVLRSGGLWPRFNSRDVVPSEHRP